MLLTSFAIFVTISIIFLHSHDINNYFDVRPYFSFESILPALGALMVMVVLQRHVDRRFLMGVLTCASVVLLFLFGVKSAMFETFNGDDVMFIAGYMIVYEQALFMVLLATVACLIYIVAYSFLDQIRNGHFKLYRVVVNGTIDMTLFSVEVVVFLAIATRVSFGVSMIVMGGVLLASHVWDKSRGFKSRHERQAKDQVHDTRQDPAFGLAAVQSHSRAKNFLVLVQTMLVAVVTGYLWPNDFLWTGSFQGENGTFLAQVNARLILDEATWTLVMISITTLIIATSLTRRAFKRAASIKNLEGILMLATNILLWSWMGLMYTGTAVLGVRVSNILAPWVIMTYGCSIIVFIARRKRDSPGLHGAILATTIACMWLGLILGKDGEIDGIGLVLPVVLAGCAVIWALVYVHATRNVLEPHKGATGESIGAGRRERDECTGPMPKACASLSDAITKIAGRSPKAVHVVLLLSALVLPAMFISIPVTSPGNFQLLANVDNQCIFFLADPTTRIDKDYRTRFGLDTFTNVNSTIQIHAARNEYESIQVVMQPINQKHFSIYNILFSGFKNATGDVIIGNDKFSPYRVRPVEELTNIVPDVLEPFSPFAVADGSAVPLWLTFQIPNSTAPGDYNGTITLHVDDKNVEWSLTPEQVILNIRLHVFNFTVPEIPSLKSAFGIADPGDVPNLLPMFKEYRMMYWSPGAPLPTCTLHANGSVASMNFTATDAFIEQLHVSGTYWTRLFFYPRPGYLKLILPPDFIVNGINYTNTTYFNAAAVNNTLREYLELFANYYKTEKNYTNDFGRTVSWFDDMYINGHDEIDGVGGTYKVNALVDYRYLADLECPFPLMQTVGGYEEDTFTVLESLPDAIICWHTGGYEADHVAGWKASGRDAWIYTTRGPRFPAPSLSTSGFATQVRALGWQCFIYNYSTYLIWDVLTPGNARQGHAYQGWSGGTAFYKEWGGIARSTRAELIREGFEDYEYFHLLSRAPESPQKARIRQEISTLMNGFHPDMDYHHIQQIRIETGNFLSL